MKPESNIRPNEPGQSATPNDPSSSGQFGSEIASIFGPSDSEDEVASLDSQDELASVAHDFVTETELSMRVYKPLQSLKLALESEGWEKVFPVNRSFPVGAQAICSIRERQAYIAFRGSSSWVDWYFNFLLVPFPWPMRHLGFSLSWLFVRGPILGWLEDHQDSFDSVTLTGHSLGGALAFFAGHKIAGSHRIERVVTFGAPRPYWLSETGYDNSVIQGREEKLGEVTFRVINYSDIVPDLPPNLFGYREVGNLYYLTKGGGLLTGREATTARLDDFLGRIKGFDSVLPTDPQPVALPIVPTSATFPSGNQTTGQKLNRTWQKWKPGFVAIVNLVGNFFFPIVLYFKLLINVTGRGVSHMNGKYTKALKVTVSDEPDYQSFSRWEKWCENINSLLLILMVALPVILFTAWIGWKLFTSIRFGGG